MEFYSTLTELYCCRARLVDCDDCVVLGATVANAAALRDELHAHNAIWAVAGTPGALPGVVDALEVAWSRRGE